MEKKRTTDIPEKKTRAVSELMNLIKTSKSIVIVSIKNLPTSQFQLIKKKLRDKAKIKVVKKSISLRAIEESQVSKLKDFKKYIQEDIALIFSNEDAFEVSAILSKNKSKTRARVGQEVDDEVIIEPGPTELVPGPIISELTALGLKFMIEDGKISIREKKTILKKGEKVTEQAASIMGKLDMKPVSVGLEPLAAYDCQEHKIFENIKIEPEKIIVELKTAAGRALAFAVKIAYPVKETIGFLLGKSKSHEQALSKLIKSEEVK